MNARAETKTGIIAEFDARAPTYDDLPHGPMYHAHNDVVLAHLSLAPGETLLDVGPGGGYLLRQALAGTPGAFGIGIDISPRMVEVASAATPQADRDRLRFVTADWECANADLMSELRAIRPAVCVCASTVHYFADPGEAFARIHDVLAPGGKLYVMERRKNGSPLNQVWDLLHRKVIRDHVKFYYDEELISALRSAGFGNVRVIETVRRFMWKNKLFTNLSLIAAEKGSNSCARKRFPSTMPKRSTICRHATIRSRTSRSWSPGSPGSSAGPCFGG